MRALKMTENGAIKIMGGEPTLHPLFLEIVDLLLRYKVMASPETAIVVKTNNEDDKVRSTLKKLPSAVVVKPSPKNIVLQDFYAFNMAPADAPFFAALVDFSVGCSTARDCGIGLNKFGYYCCGNAAGIDRVFGFNIGRRNLPLGSDEMRDQMSVLCRLCGAFNQYIDLFKPDQKHVISSSWKKAYDAYHQK